MALEASDRLIDNWRCTCECISRPTFKLGASLLDDMGKSKEISQNLRKIIVHLHKSGSSLGAISKCLKVPHSSVQTIVCKYKHRGTTQLSYSSGRRCVPSPRDECTLRVRARRPTNLTRLHQLCQEEWATFTQLIVGSYPKHLTQVKQFKGNATKY
jgi:hypothetical protein